MARVSDDRRQNDKSQTDGQVKTCGRTPRGEAARKTASRSLVPSGPSAPAKRNARQCKKAGLLGADEAAIPDVKVCLQLNCRPRASTAKGARRCKRDSVAPHANPMTTAVPCPHR